MDYEQHIPEIFRYQCFLGGRSYESKRNDKKAYKYHREKKAG